ncbi:tetratricopeptide repeat protein [Kribbella sp. NPDC051770]|uniref:tetratricopeptide repeat protein n=1 Tax=Kribbella sp. NPDC051770 TaxID=3155413 RepID=UPI00342ED59A
MTVAGTGEPPSPAGARTIDELSVRLRRLQSWSGVSFRELHRRVLRSRQERGIAELPAYNTVYRCLLPGRSRLDVELVVDIARALLTDQARVAEWRQVHQVVSGLAAEAAVVRVADVVGGGTGVFVGRTDTVSETLAEVSSAETRLVLVDGMPGVGKTTLAEHLAGQLIGDAEVQLSVNLRGYDPDRPPADPAAVLDGFLRHLGVAGSRIHGLGLAARAGLFRELLGDRRAVVLLDNAASEDQLQPLLVESPSCVTLVTSRRRMAGPEYAVRVHLDVFEPEESALLLGATAPEVKAQLADAVGHLPLALALLAARMKAQPSWSAEDHLERLLEHQSRLRLDDGVAAALSMSYQALEPASQRMLRLLTLHPGRDLDVQAAAALTGVPSETALEDLVAASLLRKSGARYELHDLVRVFALDRVSDEEPAPVRRAAVAQLLAHYRSLVAAAASAYAPVDRNQLDMLRDHPADTFAGLADAQEWLDTERHNLIATALAARELGHPSYATDLSMILQRYLDTAAFYDDAVALHREAVSCAETDRLRGRSYNNLGCTYWRLGRYVDARDAYQQALEVARRIGHPGGEACSVVNIGMCNRRLGGYADAIALAEQALALFDASGNKSGTATALAELGWSKLRLGLTGPALEHFRQGLAVSRELGERSRDQAEALTNVAEASAVLGLRAEALLGFRAAVDHARRLAAPLPEAEALNGLGRLHRAAGQIDEALARHDEALRLAVQVGSLPVTLEVANDYGFALTRAGRYADGMHRHQYVLSEAHRIDDRYEVGRACAGIGEILAAQGLTAAATDFWWRAYTAFLDLGCPEAAVVGSRLATAGHRTVRRRQLPSA